MKPANLIEQNYPPSILMYGLAGSGKTALATQLSNGYVFDFDDGMRTAAKLKDKFFDLRQGIEFDTYIDIDPQSPHAWLDALKKLMEFVALARHDKLPYDAIIVDSFSMACRAAQLHSQSLGSKNNPTKDPLAKMEINNWGSVINEIERFLSYLRALRKIIIVISHCEIEEEHPNIGETRTVAMFPRSITKPHAMKSLQTYFDEVLYCEAQRGAAGKINYRVMGKSPNGIIKTRSRSCIDVITHNETGMIDLLNQMGYNYEVKK